MPHMGWSLPWVLPTTLVSTLPTEISSGCKAFPHQEYTTLSFSLLVWSHRGACHMQRSKSQGRGSG